MKENMNNIVSYLKSKDPEFDATVFKTDQRVTPATKKVVKQEISSNKAEAIEHLITYMKDNPEIMQQVMSDARKLLDEKGIDYNKYEQTRKLVTDESYYFEVLRSSVQ